MITIIHKTAVRLVGVIAVCCLYSVSSSAQASLSVVELNAENMFDTQHDTLKNDYDFLPESAYRWTRYRYWEKLNKVGQEILACGQDSGGVSIPDLVGLCEVENDTVMRDLTKRSLLRKARYEYVMTDSPDERGIDVALMYSPFSFSVIRSYALRVAPPKGMKPTRDILYTSGKLVTGDTLHVFVVHAPSRRGGEKLTRGYRQVVVGRLAEAVDSLRGLSPNAYVIVMGDFNDYAGSPALRSLYAHDMVNVSEGAHGSNGAKGTYRYHGEWGSLDQMVVSGSIADKVESCLVFDAPFLLEEDTKYGGVKPFRFYMGPRYHGGYSDHLPLVLRLRLR